MEPHDKKRAPVQKPTLVANIQNDEQYTECV